MSLPRLLISVAMTAGLAAPVLAQDPRTIRPKDENFNQTVQSCDDILSRERRAECIKQRTFDGQGATPSYPAGPFCPPRYGADEGGSTGEGGVIEPWRGPR